MKYYYSPGSYVWLRNLLCEPTNILASDEFLVEGERLDFSP